jgi:hypothetical protein
MEIFEQSHLYYEEEGLEEFVGECIDVLGSYLADKQTDRVAREKSIAVLFAIYRMNSQSKEKRQEASMGV